MALIEFDHHNLQKIKLLCHSLQAVMLFFNFILEIIVFSRAQSIDGRVDWQFGLIFLSIPALIYLTMTLRFPRTRKLAQPYALATVDFIFAIFWISGFTAQASFNSSGKCSGACGVSKAVVGLGVIVWLIWVLTTIFSLYGVMFWKREGYLPGISRVAYNSTTIDPDKEAFSTAPIDDEYVSVHNADEHEHPYYSSPLSSYYESPESVGGYAPSKIRDTHEETAYTGYAGAGVVAGERVNFPEARYDNV